MLKKIIKKIKLKNMQKILSIFFIFFLSLYIFPLKVDATSTFNTASGDHHFEIVNSTQHPGSTNDWTTSLSGINPGDEINFSVYYHNASDATANNTKVQLTLDPTGASTNFTTTSQISADSFQTHTENVSLALTASQSITFNSSAKWIHGNNQTDTVNVTVSGNTVSFDLGQVNPGYEPNDGFIIFKGTVSTGSGPAPIGPTSDAGSDQTVNPGNTVTLNGSNSTGSNITYAWDCTGGVTLTNPNSVQSSFTIPNDATSGTSYTCTLTVTDDNSNFASDDTVITVTTGSSGGGGGGTGSIEYYGGSVLAKILEVTENNNGSVTLNGKITECEKDDCSARFLWGSNKRMENTTEWIENLKKGSDFSHVLIGLKKGKTYYAGLETKMEISTFKTKEALKFITRPDHASSFQAVVKDNIAHMTWGKGEGGEKTIIKRGINGCPDFDDASAPTIYFGEGSEAFDKALGSNQNYCYNAWMINYDGLEMILSDPVNAVISTGGEGGVSEIEKKDKEEPKVTAPIEKTETPVLKTETPKTTIIPRYELSLNNFARNTSLDKLEWEKSISVSPNDNLEFYIELENTGNVSLKDVIITNLIGEGIKDIKNITINDIKYPNKILKRAFIKELKPNENVKISFEARIDELEDSKGINLVTETFSNKTKTITSIVKINKVNGYANENTEASLLKSLKQGGLYPWLILLLVIAIIYTIYRVVKRKNIKIEE